MNRRALFVLAILASSFLIFLVQPMVGKRILPWFGGTPSVWTLCLAFYQTTLFAGYAYAHLLIRFASPLAQLGIHTLILCAAFIALPVLPGDVWQPGDVENPSARIMAMLTSNVALPFIALASTGPLVQAWFARAHPGRSPYPLYAVSNLGSFAALLAYPFFFEPRLSLSETGTLWSWAFAATAVAVLACAFVARTAQAGLSLAVDDDGEDGTTRPTSLIVSIWVLLAGCAVILLMGTTNSLCLDIASVPFLWILPLATYLLTFIVSFASERSYRPLPYALLAVVAFGLTIGRPVATQLVQALTSGPTTEDAVTLLRSLYLQVPAYCALLFATCMIMHGELYRLRPPPRSLTAFYLCVSGGGALGGLFVGILAPVLFDDYHELRVGLGLSLLLFTVVVALRNQNAGGTFRSWRWRLAVPTAVVLGLVAIQPPSINREVVVHYERSFFGVLRVLERGRSPNHQRHLVSGSTIHGVEFTRTDRPPIPTSYYGSATGIAAAFAQRPPGQYGRVGLIGLGVGTLSAYGRAGDSFRYYEIDPAVAEIARDSGYFSFLEKSPADVEIVVADARLAMTREQEESGGQEFDFLVLDAFSSDAIPVHLLTREAFEVYRDALAPDGVLAVHVSNRHFDLLPLVARVGLEVGLASLNCGTAPSPRHQSQAADWMMLSRDATRLVSLEKVMKQRMSVMRLPRRHAALRHVRLADVSDLPVWTDDYSNLLRVLRAN